MMDDRLNLENEKLIVLIHSRRLEIRKLEISFKFDFENKQASHVSLAD